MIIIPIRKTERYNYHTGKRHTTIEYEVKNLNCNNCFLRFDCLTLPNCLYRPLYPISSCSECKMLKFCRFRGTENRCVYRNLYIYHITYESGRKQLSIQINYVFKKHFDSKISDIKKIIRTEFKKQINETQTCLS